MPIYIHGNQKVKALFWHSLLLRSSYPPVGSRKCYCNRDDSWMEPNMAGKVSFLNGVSMRCREDWPFSDSHNVRYFPLWVNEKTSLLSPPWMGALLNRGVKERRPFLLNFPYRMQGETAIKSDPHLFLNFAEQTQCVSFADIVWPHKCVRDGECIQNWHGLVCGTCSNVLPNAGWYEPLNKPAFISVLCASIILLFSGFILQLKVFRFIRSDAIKAMVDITSWCKIRQTLRYYSLIKPMHLTLLLQTLSSGQHMQDLCCCVFCHSKDILI